MKTIRLLAIIEATSITGPAKNLLRFAKAADSNRFGTRVELSIITFQRGEKANLFLETAQRAGIETFPVAETGAFDRAVVDRLVTTARAIAPDLIQTHAVKSHFLAAFGGLSRIAPWIAFHHGYTWPNLKARAYNELDRWSVRRANRVLTVSLPFRQQMISRGVRPENIEVIHNAIDPDWGQRISTPQTRAELRAQLNIPEDNKVILIVGRLSKEKDHETLINAFGRLQADVRGHLLIVGDGTERTNLERQIQRLHLEGHVTITGQVPSAEPYYAISDVCVLSSLSEGSPNALLEAMAARVPVVATRVGGIPEIVTDRESALLLTPRDEKGMVSAIRELLSNSRVRQTLVAHAHSQVTERYTPDRRTERLLEVYSRVLASTEAGIESALHTRP